MNNLVRFDLHKLSDARSLILGIATIWIVIYHSWSLNFFLSHFFVKNELSGALTQLRMIGDSGVDFFLFFSAFGLYFSLKKNSSLKRFYSRRFVRVLPELLIVSILFYSIFPVNGLSNWISKVLIFGFFESGLPGGNHYWYFALLFVLYFLYPAFHYIVDHWKFAGALLLILFSILGAYILSIVNYQYYLMIDIATVRVPIFVAGIWFGKLSYDHVSIPKWFAWASIVFSLIFIVLSCHMRYLWLAHRSTYEFFDRYEYFPMVVFMSIAIAYIHSVTKRNVLEKLTVLIGSYSLEIYLLYEALYLNLKNVFKSSDPVGWSYAITIFVLSFSLAVILKQINHVITDSILK